MSEFGIKLKDLLMRGAKAIGRAANTTAKVTQYKVNEISLVNKQRELHHELGKKVMELCKTGLILPDEAHGIVEQLNHLSADLDVLRANHVAEKAAAAEQHAMEKAARATEKAAAKAAAAIAMSTEPVEVEAPTEELCAAPTEETAAPVLELDIEKAAEDNTNSEIPTLNV